MAFPVSRRSPPQAQPSGRYFPAAAGPAPPRRLAALRAAALRAAPHPTSGRWGPGPPARHSSGLGRFWAAESAWGVLAGRRGPGPRRAPEPPPHPTEPGAGPTGEARSLLAVRSYPRGAGSGLLVSGRPAHPPLQPRPKEVCSALRLHGLCTPSPSSALHGWAHPLRLPVKASLSTLSGPSRTPSPSQVPAE